MVGVTNGTKQGLMKAARQSGHANLAAVISSITMAGVPCQKKKKKEEEKGKADLTTVLHIRELPHLHMKLAVWFSFPTTNNKNPMIPS